MDKIRIAEKFSNISEHWRPKVVAQMNGQEVKLVKFKGEFVWHRHVDTDEFFHVLSGDIDIALRETPGHERVVHLAAGSVFTVPRGVEHKPSSVDGASVLLFEPSSTVNTGDRSDDIPAHIRSTTGRDITTNP